MKKEYPNWHSLTKKEKKTIAKKVLDEVIQSYDFKQEIEFTVPELLGIANQLPTAGIMTLEEMGQFIEAHTSGQFFKLNSSPKHPLHLQDEELRIIDKILSYDGYTPAMRELFPHNYLRAELLKAIKHPEISYRKFCGDDKNYKGHKQTSDYIGMGNNQNRAFIGLPLNRNQTLSHVQLCQFRNSLSFKQMVNLTVYILYLFMQTGLLSDKNLHCVDSTELAVERQELLASITVKGRKIKIYDDLDCDCGHRRTKRDKSVYVVGYRMHTLTAINAETGQSFPLLSLMAPANHHDSLFLSPLVNLGKAIGLDIKLITADEAYHDKDGTIFEKKVHLVTPPSSNVSLPENFDKETLQVRLDDLCDIPMDYVGIETEGHEFKCGASSGECPRSAICPQFRHIPFDNGYFQRIIYGSDAVKKALEIRKNGERPFNLLKKREGLEFVSNIIFNFKK
ncbi:Uncharacterized protein dnl_59460 [Desulfonema limicola]|uniref:Transposase n=1 Tax=Desulfonema limicola TaxID=45656 RepID=A0A975GJH8_9BACT|nr:Uncharacterized protein dnl_59460 [Desulfonema limicola]